jgi:uncharacterized protein YhbP (UPF0306 family)
VAIRRSTRPIAAARLTTVARRLLDASTLCAIATVSRGGRAHVNTAYFAWSKDFDLVWLSEPHAKHSSNVRTSGTAAVAVFDPSQTWGKPDRGIQLFGAARQVAGDDARRVEEIYAKRFPPYRELESSAYRFYRFSPSRVKLFDEHAFRAGVFVTARVSRGKLVWERTEIYDASS